MSSDAMPATVGLILIPAETEAESCLSLSAQIKGHNADQFLGMIEVLNLFQQDMPC